MTSIGHFDQNVLCSCQRLRRVDGASMKDGFHDGSDDDGDGIRVRGGAPDGALLARAKDWLARLRAAAAAPLGALYADDLSIGTSAGSGGAAEDAPTAPAPHRAAAARCSSATTERKHGRALSSAFVFVCVGI